MKIVRVDSTQILFDNGAQITYDHYQDCCEHNYADFKQIEDLARKTEFDEDLVFEEVEDAGFRFGNPNKMFFIPCYSEQNGYYTTNIEIHYNDCKILSFNAVML